MQSFKGLRSLNPALAPLIAKTGPPTHQYGFRNVVRPQLCQDLIDKLDLKSKYPNSANNLDIIDVFPGYGLFSTMVNFELNPRKHVLMDTNKQYVSMWRNRIDHLRERTGNSENFVLYEKDGYTWETYNDLIEKDKIIQPETRPSSQIHDELLIIGNLTPLKFGEALFAQWLMCCAYGNWMQKYGRVRMLCFATDHTAAKFCAQEKFTKRNKSGIKRDTFTETSVIAVTELKELLEPDGFGFDPTVLIKDQPVILPIKAVLPEGNPVSLLEVNPRDLSKLDIDVDLYEYLLKILMFRSSSLVIESLSHLAPGAEIDLPPKIPNEILQKSTKELSVEEILTVYNVFNNWAFKPSFEEMVSINDVESRRF